MDEANQAQLEMSANYDAEEHLFRTEITGNKIAFSIDGEEVGELDREVAERYYMITPDPYTSHYTGTISIDSIRIAGMNVQAVQPESRLAATWGSVKNQDQL